MREIKAIIQPFVIDKVIDALEEIPGLPGITISEVRGYSRPAINSESIRDVKKIRLEVVVQEAMVNGVVERISRAAHTGNPGDGKIFVLKVEDAIEIRTGEHGHGATQPNTGE